MSHYRLLDMKPKLNDAEHILVIEDNPDDQWLTFLSFGKPLRNPLDIVATGEAALEYLRDNPPPLLILLDLGLPGRVSGFDILTEAQTRNIPVIVLTGSDEIATRTAAYARAATAYLVKPVNFDELRRKITTVDRFEWELRRRDS